MNLRRIFRRTRPSPVPQQLDPHEARVMSAWGLDAEEWASLTATERARLRTLYTKAPRYKA